MNAVLSWCPTPQHHNKNCEFLCHSRTRMGKMKNGLKRCLFYGRAAFCVSEDVVASN